MKSPAELKDAHDLLCAACSGHFPIAFSRKDRAMLEAQYDVLCWASGCEANDCFKNSMDSLKELLDQVDVLRHGRKFKSQALVE